MIKKKIRLIFFLLFCTGGMVAFGQDGKTVSGTIRDSAGNNIPGVTVGVKGTKRSVAADADGNFRIEVPSSSSTLVFSSIGYETKEVPVSAGRVTNAVLSAQRGAMNEVVVTGLGIKKNARKVSYATTEIKGSDLVATNTTNLGDALQGKVAGVTIAQGTNGPSSSSRITIRGNARLDGNTEPLVVIDGILITPSVNGADSYGNNPQDFGNIIKDLNPDDYESVTVLKGSAATALYGQQALNGVLLIVTKKGKARKGVGITFNQTLSYQKAYKMLDLQNEFGGGLSPTWAVNAQGIDTVTPAASVWPNPNGGYSYGPKFDGHMVKDLDGRMVPWGANNPLKDFFQTGQYKVTNVAADGGNENTTFRVSYTNVYSSSIVPNNSLNKNSFTLRGTQKLNQSISLDASVNYTQNKIINPIQQGLNESPVIGFTEYMPRSAPISYWVKNKNYNLPGGGINAAEANDPYGFSSILWPIYMDNIDKTENVLLGNLDFNAKVTSWLSLLVRGNITAYNDVTETKNPGVEPGYNGNGYIDNASVFLASTQGDTYNYQINTSSYKNTLVSAILTANKDLTPDLNLTASLGAQSYAQLGGPSTSIQTNGGLTTPLLYFIGNSVLAPTTSGSDVNVTNPTDRQNAIYLFGDLTYKNQLTMNYSLRQDYSSTLTYADGHGDYHYLYPMVGFAWTFTELPAFKTQHLISFGKLRASLGYSGHDATFGTTPYITNNTGYYGANSTNYWNPPGTTTQSYLYGFNGTTLGNQNLKNELAREWEVGADVRFFQNRVGLDVAWYKKNAFNQIIPLNVTPESGVSSIEINAGNIQNQGIEALLTVTPVRTKSFTWNASVNFTRNRNEVIKLYPGVKSYTMSNAFGGDVQATATPGKQYGEVESGFGFATYNGANKSLAGMKVIGNTGYGTDNGPTGSTYTYMRAQDYDGSTKDLGSMMPDFLIGTVQDFTYKSFTFMFQVDSKVGGLLASATDQYGMETGDGKASLRGRNTQLGGVTYTDNNGNTRNDGIIPNGVLNDGLTGIGGANVGGMTYATAVKNGALKPIPAYEYYENLTDWASGIRAQSIFDNSFVAVRQVSIGYNLSPQVCKPLHVNTLRFSVTGRNLFYIWKDAKDGVNPEGLNNNNASSFFEYGGLPFQRNLGATLNASF